MMLRYSFALEEAAAAVEAAVERTLEEDYRTYDIMGAGKKKVGTSKMGDLITERLGG